MALSFTQPPLDQYTTSRFALLSVALKTLSQPNVKQTIMLFRYAKDRAYARCACWNGIEEKSCISSDVQSFWWSWMDFCIFILINIERMLYFFIIWSKYFKFSIEFSNKIPKKSTQYTLNFQKFKASSNLNIMKKQRRRNTHETTIIVPSHSDRCMLRICYRHSSLPISVCLVCVSCVLAFVLPLSLVVRCAQQHTFSFKSHKFWFYTIMGGVSIIRSFSSPPLLLNMCALVTKNLIHVFFLFKYCLYALFFD